MNRVAFIAFALMLILLPAYAEMAAQPVPHRIEAPGIVVYKAGTGKVYAVIFSKDLSMIEADCRFTLTADITELLISDLNKDLWYMLRKDGVPMTPFLKLIPITADSPEAYALLTMENAEQVEITLTVILEPRKGDFNGDGRIGWWDLFQFVFCWHSRAGEPEYSVIADFNDDGVIDGIDLDGFCLVWHKRKP